MRVRMRVRVRVRVREGCLGDHVLARLQPSALEYEVEPLERGDGPVGEEGRRLEHPHRLAQHLQIQVRVR